jgi:hypothetical protein
MKTLELKLTSVADVLKLIDRLMTEDPFYSGAETYDYSSQLLSLLVLGDQTQQEIIVL